ncbi:hypothetical protein BZG36_04481, partial [Bifiguratus adelaidae]
CAVTSSIKPPKKFSDYYLLLRSKPSTRTCPTLQPNLNRAVSETSQRQLDGSKTRTEPLKPPITASIVVSKATAQEVMPTPNPKYVTCQVGGCR